MQKRPVAEELGKHCREQGLGRHLTFRPCYPGELPGVDWTIARGHTNPILFRRALNGLLEQGTIS